MNPEQIADTLRGWCEQIAHYTKGDDELWEVSLEMHKMDDDLTPMKKDWTKNHPGRMEMFE